MSIFSIECPDIGCYQNYLCDPEFQNKVIAVAYVKKSAAANINKTSASLWMQSLFTEYAKGNAYLVLNTSGEKPKPETGTTAGRGYQTTKALAKNHTLTYMDMQGVVKNNVVFYNDILATAQNYDFYYFTPDRIWDASGNYVTVIGDPIIGADINTYMQSEVSVQWTSKVNPLPEDFPTQTFLEGLYLEIALATHGTTISLATNSSGNDLLNATYSQTISSFTQNITYSIIADAATITALGLSVSSNNDTTGTLSWSGVDAGTWDVKIQAVNEAGCVYGELNLTFIVS